MAVTGVLQRFEHQHCSVDLTSLVLDPLLQSTQLQKQWVFRRIPEVASCDLPAVGGKHPDLTGTLPTLVDAQN